MDCVTFANHLSLDCELGYGFLLFGSIKLVSENLGVFLLFWLGLKFLNSDSFFRVLVRFLYGLRWKSGKFNKGFCSKGVCDGKCVVLKLLDEDSDKPLVDKMNEKSNLDSVNDDSDDEYDDAADNGNEDGNDDNGDEKDCKLVDDELDVSALRKLIEIERRKANEAAAELEKERAASATAAEEAMAMILRLQNEKSLIELESSQYRRLAEEKQIHDQQVIESLQWLVWRHESERGLLEDQLKSCKRMLKGSSKRFVLERGECEEEDEDQASSFNGSIMDALENVLYSSRAA